MKDISTSDLAAFTNALLVTCMDPRKFHGLDLIKEMRTRVSAQNYTNPYIYLTLCNAGETITRKDIEKLTEAFWSKHREFWTGEETLLIFY